MHQILRQRVKEQGIKSCIECGSMDIEYFDRVYIEGELFSFPYCRHCGLVQWHVISGFHLSLEKLYELFLQLADELEIPYKKILCGLEYIKKTKGDSGFSDDVAILKEILGTI